MSDAMSDYYKQVRLEKKARKLLSEYQSASGEEKKRVRKNG